MKNILPKRLTIYDLAEKTGVSIATVSRVINNAPNVNEHTRLKILKLLDATSYKPKVVKNRLPCIGVLLEAEGLGINLFNDYNAAILSGVSDYVFKHGLALSIFPFSSKAIKHPDDLMRHLQERGIDGVVVIYRKNYDKCLSSLHANMFPHFSIGGGRGVTPFSISYEEEKAVEMAIDHFIELGHKRIGFVSTDSDNDSPKRRIKAFRKLTKSKDCIAIDDLILKKQYHTSHKRLGYETIMNFKDSILENPPDALLCTDVNIAVGVLKAFDEVHIAVPDDISVIGFNNSEFSEYTNPSLSVVSHPFYEMGLYAAENIFCRLNGGQVSQSEKLFNPDLILRKSCGAAKRGGK